MNRRVSAQKTCNAGPGLLTQSSGASDQRERGPCPIPVPRCSPNDRDASNLSRRRSQVEISRDCESSAVYRNRAVISFFFLSFFPRCLDKKESRFAWEQLEPKNASGIQNGAYWSWVESAQTPLCNFHWVFHRALIGCASAWLFL